MENTIDKVMENHKKSVECLKNAESNMPEVMIALCRAAIILNIHAEAGKAWGQLQKKLEERDISK